MPVPDSDDVFPSASGDYSYSKYDGETLEEILADSDEWTPESWHRAFSKICTKKVIDNRDKIATEPAVRASQLGPLLRTVGAESEASYCDLIAMIRAFSRGVDNIGKKVTVQENLAQIHAFLDELTSMREACGSLEQSDRGAARLRGFVSQDSFNLVKLTVGSFDGIVHFVSVANGFSLDKFRSTPPYSAVNETSHAMLRAISKNLLISAVARGTGQVVQANLIVSNKARTWI